MLNVIWCVHHAGEHPSLRDHRSMRASKHLAELIDGTITAGNTFVVEVGKPHV